MSIRALSLAMTAAVTVAVPSDALASIKIFNDAGLYQTAAAGFIQSAVDLDVYSGQYSTPLTGSAGAVNWSANAAGGLTVTSAQLSSTDGGAMRIDLTGASVFGISGNFFASNGGTLVPALVFVSLNDGTGFANFIDTESAFLGFISTTSAISSIEITAMPVGSGSVAPTVDNLAFAYVPAPGAMAILAVAGLVGTRRRR
jgi:hypothetical protein